ncbi:hypothetical protein SSIL_2319 [Solibacillus silvestris StLB046]|uniref:Uncharacterized protein n=1 Tax=Solibacillus silvestris (strain StLB046) TaxID=1002809 RepID=F2FAH5_SOLSS|nr:hypothetical protein SSIL_2319 [Solibacillus silvestris StLB046]
MLGMIFNLHKNLYSHSFIGINLNLLLHFPNKNVTPQYGPITEKRDLHIEEGSDPLKLEFLLCS